MLFFYLLEPPIINGFVQSAGQNVQLTADLGYTALLIQEALGLGQQFNGQPVALPPLDGLEKSSCSALTVTFATTLDRGDWNPKGFDNISLAGGSVDNQLSRKKPEAGQIIGRMGKDWQVTVEINHLILSPLKGQFRCDVSGSGRKQWKLNLGHAEDFPMVKNLDQAKNYIPINPTL